MRRLAPAASIAWKVAAAEAAAARHAHIESAHLLIGILSLEKVIEVEETDAVDREAIASEVEVLAGTLERLSLEAATLRRRLRGLMGVGSTNHHGRPVSRTTECKDAFRRAKEVAGGSISALALLVSLLERPDDSIRAALDESDVSPAMLRNALLKIDLEEVGAGNEKTSTPTLDRFGRDLTKLAVSGKLGPVIGRRRELLLLLQTLARRSKNNPVLVGDAGVGKTAIVEALAIRAAAGKDKAVLDGKRIVELNMGALLAGTKYRGEFEKRLTHILSEVKRNPRVVIFIDEIHTVMGAGGGGDQPLDAANMLKPALARGELRCVGATTTAEYRRHIEADPALERRFEKVLVGEPTREETLEILRGLRPKWEEHHQVRILDESLEAAVDLSFRFDPEHRLPDKAIDLVDKAAARTRIPILSAMAPEQGGPITSGGSVYGDVTEEAVAYVLAEKRGIPPERVMEGLESSSGSRLLELESFLQKRLIGQDEAVHRVSQRLRLAHSGMKTRRGPMAVFLFLDTIRILRPWIQTISEKLMEQHGVSLTVPPEAEDFIARAGYSPSLGARELQRTLERLLQVPLSNLILSGKIKRHKDWKLVYEEGGVYLLPRTA